MGPDWKKSSRSAANGHCVEVAWTVASDCANGECVEAGLGACGRVHVRDSKDCGGPELKFPPRAWEGFLACAKAGEFDLEG